MALVFNPFTGNFDNVIASSSEMSMSDGTLTVNGDINLDDGGAFSTTVQAVTPTANRTISFPDATGTVALVNGANGTIQYNDAGTLNGNSDFTVDPDWNDASTVFTGLKLNVTDTASAAGSNLLDLQSGGTSNFKVSHAGDITFNNATLVRTDATSLVFSSSDGYQRVLAYSFGDTNSSVRIGDPGVAGNVRLSLGSGAELGWCSSTIVGTSADLTLQRAAAGVVKVTDGSTGDGTISAQLRAVGTAPAATGSTGTAGDIRYDAGYIYVCTATNTWKRAALATW
jgi:hypothetical protein